MKIAENRRDFSILEDSNKLFVEVKASFSGGDELILTHISGVESLSELFTFTIRMTSKNHSLNLDKALSSKINITLKSDSYERHIDGIITEFSQGATEQKNDIYVTEYLATIRPKLWLLTLDNNYLIFQGKKTIDIIKKVLKDNGITDIEDKTSSCGKVVREYCVQYAESSFNFVSRLMEEVGIFYFFKHEKNKHTLVLADSASAYTKINGDTTVEFLKISGSLLPIGKVFNTSKVSSLNTGGYSTADYNYELSKTKLFSKSDSKWKGEVYYDYPGIFSKSKEGDDLSKIRVQIYEFRRNLFKASSTVQSMCPGHTFKLKEHHVSNFNTEYAVYSVEHMYEQGDTFVRYMNNFHAFEKNIIFRAERKTQKPKIHGSQTAFVTGKDSEEIFRDKLCCVKVHFHWDQIGKIKDNTQSSCWVRVAQILAGSGWGGVFVPRIGQEVVVNFLDGDPDRPLIVGAVYNDAFVPAYGEKDAYKSSMKTVTFKGDKSKLGFNELRFYDEKDKEEIYMHAQKDMYIDIINARKTEIEESDDLLDIFKGSRTIKLQAKGDNPGNLTTTLTKGDMITELKEGHHKLTLTKGNQDILLKKGNHSLKLSDGNYTGDVKGNYTLKVDGNLIIEATGTVLIKSGKDMTVKSGANYTLNAAKNADCKSGVSFTVKAGTNLAVKTGTDFKIEGGTNGVIKTGVNFDMKAGVGAKLEGGVTLACKGGVSAKVEGGVSLDLKSGVSTKVAGTIVEVTGNAMSKVSGPMVLVGGGMVKLG